MKAILIDAHEGEGEFPTFPLGANVENLTPCEESKHWMSCTINGMDIFVPDFFVKNSRLIREYNPTELIASKGDIIDIEEVVYEWFYVKNAESIRGWLPAEKIISSK